MAGMSKRYALAMITLLFAAPQAVASNEEGAATQPASTQSSPTRSSQARSSQGAIASAITTIRTGARLSWSADGDHRIVQPSASRRADITRQDCFNRRVPAQGNNQAKIQEYCYVDFS